MPYEAEDLTGSAPTRLIEEHHRMVQWLQEFPRRGVPEYLRHRYVNVEEGAALYYITGLGMSDGMGFALVQGSTVVAFDVWRESDSHSPGDVRVASLGTVSIPERMPWSRADLLRRMQSAFTSYVQQEGFAYPFFDPCTLSVERVRWEVLPEKCSALFFRQQFSRAWQQHRTKRRRLKDHLSSPLAALLLFVLVAAWQAPAAWGRWRHVPMLLAAAWALRRCLQYDSDYVFGRWLVGVRELRQPLQVLAQIGRAMNPRNLDVLRAHLHVSPGAMPRAQLTISNPSWWPVQHLRVRASTLADLFDPGLMPAVRAKQRLAEEVEARFPALQRRWLLPGQSVTWSLGIGVDTLPSSLPGRLEVLLSISRWASRERRSGPNAYLIPLMAA
ncbi:hypothetical protein [Roseateles puraquae]|jgi:hypothetical protein|uniref:hypothetical protein n=1 Tax=Roseateles puraquae TaxID=431059 RepID=UPI0031D97537